MNDRRAEVNQDDLEQELERVSIELTRREASLTKGEQELARYESEIERLGNDRAFTRGVGTRELTRESYRVRLKKELAVAAEKVRALALEVSRARERRAAIENELMRFDDTIEDKN